MCRVGGLDSRNSCFTTGNTGGDVEPDERLLDKGDVAKGAMFGIGKIAAATFDRDAVLVLFGVLLWL